MSESILTSTKKVLGVDAEYTVFDTDLVMYINGALGTLDQLGVGPADGLTIEDDTATWDDLEAGPKQLKLVKQYVAQKVRLAWDPPGTSFHIDALKRQIEELEFRINVNREEEAHPFHEPVAEDEEEVVW